MLHKSEQTQWGEPRTTENRRDYWNNYSLAVCLRARCYLTCLGLFTSLWEDSDVLLRIKCLITAIYVILKGKALPQRINYRWPGASSLTLNNPPHLQQHLKIDPWNHFWPGLKYFLLKQEIYLYINSNLVVVEMLTQVLQTLCVPNQFHISPPIISCLSSLWWSTRL